MANELLTIYNQLVTDMRDVWELTSNERVYSQQMDLPEDSLSYAIIALAPFELQSQTPLTETTPKIDWVLIGRFPYSDKAGITHLQYQLQMFHAMKARLTSSATYAGVGYNPRVSQFDPTQSEDIGEAQLEVSLVFSHSIDFVRGT